jgi:hypothetical protein
MIRSHFGRGRRYRGWVSGSAFGHFSSALGTFWHPRFFISVICRRNPQCEQFLSQRRLPSWHRPRLHRPPAPVPWPRLLRRHRRASAPPLLGALQRLAARCFPQRMPAGTGLLPTAFRHKLFPPCHAVKLPGRLTAQPHPSVFRGRSELCEATIFGTVPLLARHVRKLASKLKTCRSEAV